MDLYLAFVDNIGRTTDGKYIYRFDFTVDTESVWGDYFHVVPSGIIPDLQPDINCLTKSGNVIFPREMAIAKKSYCFSMQDCIDGIMPLIFCEIDENTIEYNDAPLFFKFGEDFEYVKYVLNKVGLELTDLNDVKKGDDSAIDELIDSMDDNNDDDGPGF